MQIKSKKMRIPSGQKRSNNEDEVDGQERKKKSWNVRKIERKKWKKKKKENDSVK